MKWYPAVFLIITLLFVIQDKSKAQLGKLMNKATNKVIDKALGNESDNQDNKALKKEPDCAREDAKVVFPFEKDYKVDMSEITVKVKNGNILLYSKVTQKYFIKNKTSDNPDGPFDADNAKVKAFDINEANGNAGDTKLLAAIFPDYIKKTGSQYTITFTGKKYGPYDVIDIFMVNASKTKFVARVTKSAAFSEKDQKAMEGMENKSQEEQMKMAMEMAQKLMQNTGGDPMAMSPKYISNLSETIEVGSQMAFPNSNIKFDEIVWVDFSKITDLSGKVLINIDRQKMNLEGDNFWLNSDNSKWATLNYGRLLYSDGTECKEVFAPYVSKENGKTVLNYMYFSPKNNAIMEASLPF
jgi:hypothetical protein